jgi:peptidoglycan/LPS O-acetylase OafA/YrhL
VRNHALDTARAFAMTVVVLAHAAIAYMVTPIGWAIQGPVTWIGADLFVWVARAMAMPLFFWLAGYFSRAVYEHGGPRGFIRQRATRVALPLVIALVPVSLALNALWDWGRAVAARGAVPHQIPALEGSTLPVTLGHLWFLYYLLVMSAIALAVVPVARRFQVRFPPALAGALSIVPLMVDGAMGLQTPLGFGIDPCVLAYEGAFFAWGWLIHANRDELAQSANRAWFELALSAVALAVLIPVLRDGGTVPGYAIGASGALSVGLIDARVGLCVRYGNQPRPLVRRISDASFLVYIVHLPIVVLLQIAIASL